MTTILLPTLLTLVQSPGTVAPAFQRTQTCEINTSITTRYTTGPAIDFPRKLLIQTRYTTEIPNEAVLQSLVMDAISSPSSEKPRPIGGSKSIYTAISPKNGKSAALKSMNGSIVFQQIDTAVARKLVRFIDYNCK